MPLISALFVRTELRGRLPAMRNKVNEPTAFFLGKFNKVLRGIAL